MSFRYIVRAAWFCCLAMLLFPLAARADAISTFDADTEDWVVVDYPFGDHVAAPGTAAVPFDGAFGNPAGSVRIADVFRATGVSAPAQYLGDKSACYGDTLTYDIYLRYTDDVTCSAVVLNGGSMSLYYDAPSPPANEWATRVVPLAESGWRVSGSTAPASQAQFQQVLGSLAGLYICTEWNTGPDDTNVDNVILAGDTPVESQSWSAIKALYCH